MRSKERRRKNGIHTRGPTCKVHSLCLKCTFRLSLSHFAAIYIGGDDDGDGGVVVFVAVTITLLLLYDATEKICKLKLKTQFIQIQCYYFVQLYDTQRKSYGLG